MSHRTDPLHKQPLPTGIELRRLIAAVLHTAGDVAITQARKGHEIDVSRFVSSLANAAEPFVYSYVVEAIKGRALAMLKRIRGGKSINWLVTKNLDDVQSGVSGVDFSFNLLRPEVVESIRRAAWDLAESTFATATLDAKRAVQAAREQLRVGVSEGETMREVSRRLFQVFGDPMRAARIATSEASRAHHEGQMAAAKQAGVSKLVWLASSDACEACLALNGKEVDVGKPFYVDPKGGTYAIVNHPPLHPNCQCACTEKLEDITHDSLRRIQAMARGPQSKSTGEGLVVSVPTWRVIRQESHAPHSSPHE